LSEMRFKIDIPHLIQTRDHGLATRGSCGGTSRRALGSVGIEMLHVNVVKARNGRGFGRVNSEICCAVTSMYLSR
jgi:hypothetical protein